MTFELLTSITGSVVRHALTGIGVYLVNQGWISADDWSQLLAGIVLESLACSGRSSKNGKARSRQQPID